MAIARKCDICSGFYDWNTDVPNHITIDTLNVDYLVKERRSFDVCPDCYKSISECVDLLKGVKADD